MYNPRVTKDFDRYLMFLKSDDIRMADEGDLSTIEGKNFEILKQTIGLRAVPEAMSSLRRVRSLKESGSEIFVGQGYVWEFAIEAVDIFLEDENPVGLLVSELDDIVLPCGSVLCTSGDDVNIEFIKQDNAVDEESAV